MTQKGQITIPKSIRESLKLTRFKKVFIELEENGTAAKIIPAYDFFEVAKKIHVKKRVNPVEARKYLEASYERA